MHFWHITVFGLIPWAFVASCFGRQTDDRVHALGEKALAAIRDSDTDNQAKFMSDVALIMARNGEQEAAYELFEQALTYIPEKDRSSQLAHVAGGMAAAGFHRDAIQIVLRIRADEQYNEDEADWVLLSIARHEAEGGVLDRAEDLSLSIADDWCRPLALADVAVVANRQSDIVRTERLVRRSIFYANQIDSRSIRMGVLQQLVEIYAGGGLRDSALEIIAREKANAKESTHAWARVQSMESTCGNVDGVRNAHANRLRLMDIPFVRWGGHDETHYSTDLAEAQARAGQLEEACETAKLVATYEYHCLTAREIAKAFIKMGRLDEALAINETIDPVKRDGWTYSQTLLDVAVAEFQNGNVLRAQELLEETRYHVQQFDPTQSNSNIDSVARIHGKLGFDSEGETWVNALQSPYAQAVALIGQANGILDRAKQNRQSPK